MDRLGSSSYPKTNRPVALFGIASVLASACAVLPGCHEFDTERDLPKRGSVGQEIYGVVCDRVGAQSLREDLTGASFRNLCHPTSDGAFSDKVDIDQLPPLDPEAVDREGNPVSLEKQKADRLKAIARVEALAHRRRDLIAALDAALPEEKVTLKRLDASDPAESCKAGEKGELTDAVADMLGRMGDLYDDGTLPQSTRSLARVVEAFQKSEEAQQAWARLSQRQGYRPLETTLGVLRPVLTYPRLRDFSNASLRLLSADSEPYNPNPPRGSDGKPLPIAGPANAAFNKLLEVGHEELLAAKATEKAPPLTSSFDPETSRVVISRPRENLELVEHLMFAEDPAFSLGASATSSARFIVRRDARGFAVFRGGAVPAPLVDADGDGLADVDALGRFKTVDGSIAPSPFAFPGAPEVPRDELGRATAGGGLLYEYIDTSHTFAAQMTKDMKGLVDPDGAVKRETLMDLAGGLPVMLGTRVTKTKTYGAKKVQYQGIKTDDSPILDATWALGAVLGDPNTDTLLTLVRQLFTTETSNLARVMSGVNAAFDASLKHPEAKIPTKSTFWDDNLEVMAAIVKEPGLLEDLLRAFADPATQDLGNVYSKFAQFKDEITYNPDDINGPTRNLTAGGTAEMSTPVDREAPITGANRSALHRFLQLIHDTNGVTACNKPDAKVNVSVGVDLQLPIGFKECEVFKIDNLAAFYLDAMVNAQQYDGDVAVPRGSIYMRPTALRIAPGVTSILEGSSGIRGFWPAAGSVVAPTPQFLNRLVFFDLEHDKKNAQTNTWISDLAGAHIGTSVCPERVINDPDPGALDASPDGKVHGLRSCAEGQWLRQRNPNTIFTWEHFGFYEAMRPVLAAFVKHRREDLFLKLAISIYERFPGADASEAECTLAGGKTCPRDGMHSYEGAIADALATDIVPALGTLVNTLDTMAVKRCDAVDGSGRCTVTTTVSGIDVLAAGARAMFDPDHARDLQLTDRHGKATALRNDGKSAGQVTPAYLLANAVNAISVAYDNVEKDSPSEAYRREGMRRARSQLVDQFLGVAGGNFVNPSIPKMAPIMIDTLRSQLLAHCPRSFTPPFPKCTWAREEMPKQLEEMLAGPLAGSAIDVLDAIQHDPEARHETQLLLRYLLDEASSNDALATVLASASDLVQIMRDDENLLPLFKVVASAMDATVYDEQGRPKEKSLVDAQMSLLARMSGKYIDKSGKQLCSREIDPNQILTKVLGKLVTPIKDERFGGQTPLEVIIDVIADVNRADPTKAYDGTLSRDDYENVGANVVDFLTNKESGLEQLYEVIRQGTKSAKSED